LTDARRPVANDNDGPAFTMTRPELEAMIRRAVHKERAHSEPVLVGKQDLARAIGISASQIDRLRKLGLPSVKIGENVRFEPAKVLEWLKQQESA